MRAFVAVDLPEALRGALAAAQRRLAAAGARVRWVAPDRLHLTLKFLGDLDEAAAAGLSAGLREAAARHEPFGLDVHGLGSFPAREPRVVWAGCGGEVGRLVRLVRDVEACAQAVGVPPEPRPFTAHVTLGRVKGPGGTRALARAVDGDKTAVFGPFEVREIVLYRSDLSPEGPRYHRLEAFPLGPGQASGGAG